MHQRCHQWYILAASSRDKSFHGFVQWWASTKQTSKRCKNVSDTLGRTKYATFLFLSHFEVICDLPWSRSKVRWDHSVKLTELHTLHNASRVFRCLRYQATLVNIWSMIRATDSPLTQKRSKMSLHHKHNAALHALSVTNCCKEHGKRWTNSYRS